MLMRVVSAEVSNLCQERQNPISLGNQLAIAVRRAQDRISVLIQDRGHEHAPILDVALDVQAARYLVVVRPARDSLNRDVLLVGKRLNQAGPASLSSIAMCLIAP